MRRARARLHRRARWRLALPVPALALVEKRAARGGPRRRGSRPTRCERLVPLVAAAAPHPGGDLHAGPRVRGRTSSSVCPARRCRAPFGLPFLSFEPREFGGVARDQSVILMRRRRAASNSTPAAAREAGCAVLAAAAPPASAMDQEPRARAGQLWRSARLLQPSRLRRGICHNNRHIVIRRPA